MTGQRRNTLIGTAAGTLWALAVVILPGQAGLPFLPAPMTLPLAGLLPALVLAAMILRGAFPGPAAETDRGILLEASAQLVLALAVWPFVALSQGGAPVIVLGLSLGLSSLATWIGAHRAAGLRWAGFAGTLGATVLSGLWSLMLWLG